MRPIDVLPGLSVEQQQIFDDIRIAYRQSVDSERRRAGLRAVLAVAAVRQLVLPEVKTASLIHDTPIEYIDNLNSRRNLFRIASGHVKPAGAYSPEQLLHGLYDGSVQITN